MRNLEATGSNVRGLLVLVLGSLLFLGTSCGEDGPDGGGAGSGNLCIVSVTIPGLFTHCSEYVGFSASQCVQGMGMYNAQCPPGYVGTCEPVGNFNPRRSYFYGALVTPQIVQSVCPGGKYVPRTM